jgi:hypothetical protein
MCCLHNERSAFVFAATSTKQKDAPGEAVDPVPICLSWPLHNRRMGGIEAGRTPRPNSPWTPRWGGKEFKFSLAVALKKGPVALYFYPKSFTSVCTIEAHEFAENRPRSAATNSRLARTPAFRLPLCSSQRSLQFVTKELAR